MGHDVNVALLAELLQLSLQTPSYPPGTSSIFLGALLFELHAQGEEPCGRNETLKGFRVSYDLKRNDSSIKIHDPNFRVSLSVPEKEETFTVRIFQEAPTTTQLRLLEAKPVRSQISLPGCSRPLDCPLAEFLRMVAERVQGRCVAADLAKFLEAALF